MFGISRRTFGLVAVAALGCLVNGTLVRGEDAPPAGTGTITGTVTANGTPVAGAKVVLLPPRGAETGAPKADAPAAAPKADAPATGDQKPGDQGGAVKHHRPKPIAETTTAADGTYTFTGVAAGTYNVGAMLKGTGIGHGEAVVAAGASVKVDITLEQHKRKPAAN